MTSRLTECVVDCADPSALARSWAAGLGYEVLEETADLVEIGPGGGSDAGRLAGVRPGPVAPVPVFVRVPGPAGREWLGWSCRVGRRPFVAMVTAGTGSATTRGADMAEYLIYFNQQWVGDHPAEWFASRGPLARAVIEDAKEAGVYVFAGGLVEDGPVISADPTSGTVVFADGPFAETKEWLGGLTVVDVPDEATARVWAGRIAEACGWPQEVRRFG